MPISYQVITPPTSEPISLSDAKSYLRLDFSDDDALISELISDARRHAENLLRKSLATQTIQLIHEFDHVATGPISGPVDVPYDTWRLAERPDIPLFGNALVRLQCFMGPVQSFTSLEYQLTRMDVPEWTTLITPDSSGSDTYRLDSYADPNEINVFTILAATRFRLTYVAGYPTLPFDIRRKLLKLIAFLYDNRGAPIPAELDAELISNRVFML
jgi:hypothetical protein